MLISLVRLVCYIKPYDASYPTVGERAVDARLIASAGAVLKPSTEAGQ